jgi:hypothetical protein
MNSFNETTRLTVRRTQHQQTKQISSNSVEDYYSDYDLMIGIRIAISLGALITLFAIFILYKTKCNARKTKRLFQASLRNRNHGLDNLEFRTRTMSE